MPDRLHIGLITAVQSELHTSAARQVKIGSDNKPAKATKKKNEPHSKN